MTNYQFNTNPKYIYTAINKPFFYSDQPSGGFKGSGKGDSPSLRSRLDFFKVWQCIFRP